MLAAAVDLEAGSVGGQNVTELDYISGEWVRGGNILVSMNRSR